MVGTVFMDLSRAFDAINHDTLISKLKSYGINEKEISWFCDYLFRRFQTVDYNGKKSSKYPLSTGLPQESILGTLLFVIFFNDFHDCLRNSDTIMYADNTVACYAASGINIIEI